MLKPDAGPVYEWLATVLVDVAPRGVRIATAVRTSDGAWICDGWSATRWVEGSDPDRTVSRISTTQRDVTMGYTQSAPVSRQMPCLI